MKILSGVFDPPPSQLFIPWGYVAAVGASAVGAVVAAGLGMLAATRKPVIEIVRYL